MALEDAQAFYDDTLGAGTGFVSAQDAKDALAVTYTDMAAQIPAGVVWAWAGATAPEGWHLCDGTAHGSSALQTLLGSPNAPDLRDRFVIGAGPGHGLRQPHGTDSVTLSEANLPPHNHTFSATTGVQSANHTHGVGTLAVAPVGDHTHGLVALQDNELGADNARRVTGGSGGTITDATALGGAHSHSISGNTSGASASHTHYVSGNTSNGGGASAEITIDPKSYALTYIIKL